MVLQKTQAHFNLFLAELGLNKILENSARIISME